MKSDLQKGAKPEARPSEDDPFAKLELRPGLLGRLRNWFFAGILVTAPLGITIWVTWSLIDFVDLRVRPLIPAAWNPDNYLPFLPAGFGCPAGPQLPHPDRHVHRRIVGPLVCQVGERLLARVPVVRSIYSAAGRSWRPSSPIVPAPSGSRARRISPAGCLGHRFRHRAGTSGEVQSRLGGHHFALPPAVPNPTTGFLLFVPRKDVQPLDLTVEQGLKLVISGGVVTPEVLAAAGDKAPGGGAAAEAARFGALCAPAQLSPGRGSRDGTGGHHLLAGRAIYRFRRFPRHAAASCGLAA